MPAKEAKSTSRGEKVDLMFKNVLIKLVKYCKEPLIQKKKVFG